MTEAERQALLDAAAAGPQSASVDGQSVSARSLSELMQWADREAQKAARRAGGHGFRVTKIVPPSAVGR
jgi:hypothetical protein